MVKRKTTKKRSGRKKQGKGLVDTAIALWQGRDRLPPNVRKIMEKHGNDEIDYIIVARNALQASTKLALDVASLGAFSRNAKKLMKEKNYDDIFHLYAIITLKNGKNILTEKNAQINMEFRGVRRDATTKMVNVNKKLTLNTLMANTKKRMGAKFLPYDPQFQNCQHYILNILKANNLGNETIFKFIKQDIPKIFEKSPIFAKVTRLVTDLGAKLDILTKGAGVKKRGRPRKSTKKGTGFTTEQQKKLNLFKAVVNSDIVGLDPVATTNYYAKKVGEKKAMKIAKDTGAYLGTKYPFGFVGFR